MVSEKEVHREAARVFRLLVDADASLRRHRRPGRSASGGNWKVWNKNGRRQATAEVSDMVVRAFISCGWILETCPGRGHLSDAGHEWCRAHSGNGSSPENSDRAIGMRRIDDDTSTPVIVRINHAESPLSWLHNRRNKDGGPIIDEAQFGAGETLRQDFEAAMLRQSVTSRWDAAAPIKTARQKSGYRDRDLSAHALDARRRFHHAVDALGPELAGVAVDTCCHLQGLEETEIAQGWPRRSAKVILQIALTQLARHYGLCGNAGNPSGV